MSDFEKDAVHLVRLALDGRVEDVTALSRRLLRAIAQRRPDLEGSVQAVLTTISADPTRANTHPLPVDLDSRLELLRREVDPTLAVEPTWPEPVQSQLEAVVMERAQEARLHEAGVSPTRSLLFVGVPGVGKTLAARWLAREAKRPLLTLDLAAVMSSFLGRTGNNIRVVLDYARRSPSVLLLDEFDAIAKRRDDATEIGELKRLVTVLLQAVDEWPTGGILIAATNHPELLDPAVWRRFDRVIEFPPPGAQEIKASMRDLLRDEDATEARLELLAALLAGGSFADVSRVATAAKRSAVLGRFPVGEALDRCIGELCAAAPIDMKLRVAAALSRAGWSQRDVSTQTGLSRDTIRKHLGSTSNARRRGRSGARREAES